MNAKLLGGLAAAPVACVLLLGGAFYFDGIRFFRDIEHAETLLYIGWAAAGIVGIIVPVLIKALRDGHQTDRKRGR